jgi:DNA-directed RNA polymerase sigma subunit (sigma70/sigma32)
MLDMETTHMKNHDPDDPVESYIAEASRVEPLTKMEETKLFRELSHQGDFDEQKENALRRLVEGHLMLSVSIAKKHLAAGVPVLELMQESNVGLAKAVISFAERPIGDFTVHAAACIEDAINRYLAESK